MKNLLIVFVIVFLKSNLAFSKCNSSGISVWPSFESKINTNSIFVIEGYALSQELILSLKHDNIIYLKSGNHKLNLKIIEINQSKFYLTQAILKPEIDLLPGKNYTLEIYNVRSKSVLWTSESGWIVSKLKDSTLPKWNLEPRLFNKTMDFFGCGPAIYVNFCACINDNSQVLIRTKIKESKTGKIQEYLVIPDNSSFRIGHGMCAGEFSFFEGEKYEIAFSLLDASGNKLNKFTDKMYFNSPTKKDAMDSDSKKPNCHCDQKKNLDPKDSDYNFLIKLFGFFFLMFALIYFVSKKLNLK